MVVHTLSKSNIYKGGNNRVSLCITQDHLIEDNGNIYVYHLVSVLFNHQILIFSIDLIVDARDLCFKRIPPLVAER